MNKIERTSTGFEVSGINAAPDSDYDLLVMMTWTNTDLHAAKKAWADFFQRHVEYLYAVCRRFTRGMGGDAAAEDLARETLLHVFECAASTFTPGASKDPETMRLHVRSWLGTIAHNLAKDAYRGRPVSECHLTQEHWQDVPEKEQLGDNSQLEQLRSAMMNVLTERERDILRVTHQWHDPDRENQRLPNDVAEDLAKRWGTNSDNIRQIRSRALRKLKEVLTANMDGSSYKGDGAPTGSRHE